MRWALAAALVCLSVPLSATERPIIFSEAAPAGRALVVLLSNNKEIGGISTLSEEARAEVAQSLDALNFDYRPGSKAMLTGVGSWRQVLVIGIAPGPLASPALQDLGGAALQELGQTAGPIVILADPARVTGPAAAADIAIGAKFGGYSFDRYKSVPRSARMSAASRAPVIIVTPHTRASSHYQLQGQALVDGVYLSRDLVREPGNILYPETFVDRVLDALKDIANVKVKVLDVPQMERLGMGSILSVGRGSRRPARMLIVEYRGSPKAPLIALAGKGITFDSGGISLKPAAGMSAMKGDMTGAAAVMGTALSLARSRAPVNVVAIAALAENMPGGNASRPGDIVRAFNGRTIEILNTDGEGRLVLADAVAYAERTYAPAAIVDIATLTGAVTTALGDEYAAILSRNDDLAEQLIKAGQAAGEELWRLPLHPSYAEDMKSKIADIQNVNEGGHPGAGLGAHFIGYFVERTPWAHLDIAGVFNRSAARPTVPEGLSGYGVRLLDRFVRDFRMMSDPASGGRAQLRSPVRRSQRGQARTFNASSRIGSRS